MLGVVLWSESKGKNAVIWCEDQGELAFFGGSENCNDPAVALTVGDLVEFDLLPDCDVRSVTGLRRVAGNVCPEIVRELDLAAACAQQMLRDKVRCDEGSTVVSFRRPVLSTGPRPNISGLKR